MYGWYDDDKSIYIAMEYFELGDLSRHMSVIRNEAEICLITYQVMKGLKELHRLNIIHRDIKPHVNLSRSFRTD
jgi:serine/threonine protein kinase